MKITKRCLLFQLKIHFLLSVQPQDTGCSAVLLSGVKSNRSEDKGVRTGHRLTVIVEKTK